MIERSDWQPQAFGTRNARSIEDPLIEPLWEGERVLVHATADGEVDIVTPAGERIAEEFPEIVEALGEALQTESAVLDGYLTIQATRPPEGTQFQSIRAPTGSEMTAQMLMGSMGRDSQRRLDRALAAPVADEDRPVALVVVDLLVLDDEDLVDLPLLERKRQLDSVVDDVDLVRRTPYVRPPVDQWIASWRSQGFRGLAYKAANSRYGPGSSADDWARADMPPDR